MSKYARFLTVLWMGLVFSLTPMVTEAKTFVYRLPANPDSLDPAKTTHVFADHVMWHLYEALTILTKDAKEMKPALAESWDVSTDGLTYTFRIRKGVRFHDGTPVNAEAVKISYERQYVSASPYYSSEPRNAYESVLKGLIKDIRVIDEMTIAITLAYPRTRQFAIIKIVSPTAVGKLGKDFVRNPIGTGPFRFFSWKDGVEVVLVRNDEYWGGAPRIDRLEFRFIPSSDEAIEALTQRQVHFVYKLDPTSIGRVRQSPTVRLQPVTGLNIYYLGFYTDRPPFNDRRLREAVIRATDTQRAVEMLGQAVAIPAFNPLPPGSDSYDPKLSQPAYNPSRARQLLREAGVLMDRPLTLLYAAPTSFQAQIAYSIRDSLQGIGLRIQLKEVKTWRDMFEEAKKGMGDLFLSDWTVSTPNPERFLYPLFHSKEAGNYNLTRYSNPKVDQLLDKAREPMENSQRMKIYREVQGLIIKDMPMLFLFHLITTAGIHVGVTGLDLNLYSFPADKLVGVDVN